MRSFNERSGASSSEGGGEFEFRASTYLLFLGGEGILIPSGGSITRNYIFIIQARSKEQGARSKEQGAVPEDLK